MTVGQDVLLTADELKALIVDPADFKPDPAAFIDVRLPGSEGKASYSFVGPGVSQNPDQSINITTPHGFNVGAASMPHGTVNNPHLHYTAEVFVCTKGHWRFSIGEDGEQQFKLEADTVFSAPTWTFRGFENIGADDGWLFVVLGGDDTGGILWAPRILSAAAQTGMHLATDYSIVDEQRGDVVGDTVPPLNAEQLNHVDRYSDAELADRCVTYPELAWNDRALLSAHILDGSTSYATAVAPVIGYGLTEHRRHRAPIHDPHGFALEWLRIEPGATTGLHRHDRHQVAFVMGDPTGDGSTESDLRVEVNRGMDSVAAAPDVGSIISTPPGVWRQFTNHGVDAAHLVVVTQGDDRVRLEWDDAVLKAAADAGWSRDAGGYLAPLDLLGKANR